SRARLAGSGPGRATTTALPAVPRTARPVYGPDMEDVPAAEVFAVERAEVREGVQLAYVREGAGGYPLLLVHGWPETKRIWWRNIRPPAEAGFGVMGPSLPGFGAPVPGPEG